MGFAELGLKAQDRRVAIVQRRARPIGIFGLTAGTILNAHERAAQPFQLVTHIAQVALGFIAIGKGARNQALAGQHVRGHTDLTAELPQRRRDVLKQLAHRCAFQLGNGLHKGRHARGQEVHVFGDRDARFVGIDQRAVAGDQAFSVVDHRNDRFDLSGQLAQHARIEQRREHALQILGRAGFKEQTIDTVAHAFAERTEAAGDNWAASGKGFANGDRRVFVPR